MRLWKVRVRGYYLRPGKAKLERAEMTALVEAANSDDAMADGRHYVESNAPSDVKWEEFTVLEAASVQLPRLIDTL